mmetsp:Transcript_16510/g.14413  ORF Transcript_16510/g.14413 Transcript_16510/m.14413 type:complete len:234 (+) Transcript_16510:956-1657(+)
MEKDHKIQLDNSKNEIEELNSKLMQVENEKEKLHFQLNEINERFTNYQEQANDDIIEQLHSQIAKLNEEVQSEQEQKKTFKIKINESKKEHQSQLKLLKSENEKDKNYYKEEVNDKKYELETYKIQHREDIKKKEKEHENELTLLNNKIMILLDEKQDRNHQIKGYKKRIDELLYSKPNTNFELNTDILDLKKQIDNQINFTKVNHASDKEKMMKLEIENEKLKSDPSEHSLY